MERFQIYFIIINCLSLFFCYLFSYIQNGKIKKYTNCFSIIISLLGGSFGALLYFILFDRKMTKENSLSKIFIICLYIIHNLIYLIFCKKMISISFSSFIYDKYFLLYIVVINIFSFFIYGLDKYKAKNNKRRIKIETLFILAFLGGTLGSFIAMYLFRHKTNKAYFKYGIPIILITQLAVLLFIVRYN